MLRLFFRFQLVIGESSLLSRLTLRSVIGLSSGINR
jgi:hypothetical protein